MHITLVLILLALALTGDILTTRLAIAAGAVESNAIYGRNPDMKRMIGTHVGMFIALAALLYADPRLWVLALGATVGLALVCLLNVGVWIKQRRSAP